MNWQVNWTDGDGMMGIHRDQMAVVVVHWDWTDSDWMELLGLTVIAPKDLADEATSEDGVLEDYWILKETYVLHLPLPLNYRGRMALGHRGVEEHLLVHLVNEVGDQHGPMVQLNEPDDEVVVASQDDPNVMEEDA